MNLDKFFTLLMGECWHEWEWEPTYNEHNELNPPYVCIICGKTRFEIPQRPDYNLNPLPVLGWMREHMPDELCAFIDSILIGHNLVCTGTETLFHILNLKNLYAFLIENDEWGKTKCPECNGWGTEICYNPDHGFSGGIGYGDISRMGCPCCGHDEHNRIRNTVCKKCHGSGTILHPALRYVREEVPHD